MFDRVSLSASSQEKKKKKENDDEVGHLRRLLEANNYSLDVPATSLIIDLFSHSAGENNSNMNIEDDGNVVQRRRSNLKPDYIG